MPTSTAPTSRRWLEDMEHLLGHVSSELDSLETSLRGRREDSELGGDASDENMTEAELGLLLIYLRGWRETGEVIRELVEKCETSVDHIWREQNGPVVEGFYAERAEHYAEMAEYLTRLELRA
jgi:hypothetical protein